MKKIIYLACLIAAVVIAAQDTKTSTQQNMNPNNVTNSSNSINANPTISPEDPKINSSNNLPLGAGPISGSDTPGINGVGK